MTIMKRLSDDGSIAKTVRFTVAQAKWIELQGDFSEVVRRAVEGAMGPKLVDADSQRGVRFQEVGHREGVGSAEVVVGAGISAPKLDRIKCPNCRPGWMSETTGKLPNGSRIFGCDSCSYRASEEKLRGDK